MREFLKRGGWVFLAVLFVGTALVGGIYALVSNGSSGSQNSNYISCPAKKVSAQKAGKDGKYQNAKLVDFTPVRSVSYLQCWDLKTGTGAAATATSTVTAHYTGAVASTGIIFQSSLDTGQPVPFPLNGGVIQGWTAGIPGMKVGGERRLLIPAQYAYG